MPRRDGSRDYLVFRVYVHREDGSLFDNLSLMPSANRGMLVKTALKEYLSTKNKPYHNVKERNTQEPKKPVMDISKTIDGMSYAIEN